MGASVVLVMEISIDKRRVPPYILWRLPPDISEAASILAPKSSGDNYESRFSRLSLLRPPPLGHAVHRLPRPTDDRARRHDRERRTALDPTRPPLQPGEPQLGRQRVPRHLRK